MKRASTILLAIVFFLTFPLGASAADDSPVPMSTGEVKKVDKSSGKVTIKHGPLDNLGMPAMTMVFRVKDPAMLDQMKEGDKINFVAEKVNGAITVIQVEPAK
jgi:Cu(I)/Ag(I) efflux system protein CusF